MEPVPPDFVCLFRLCTTAAAALSRSPEKRFHGLPCRPGRKVAPEELLDKGSPDVRSDMYVLSWSLLELATLLEPEASGNLDLAAWMLDDGPEKSWLGHPGHPPLSDLLSGMAHLKRTHRPSGWQELGLLLKEVQDGLPASAGEWVFPVFAASSRHLGVYAWMAAFRMLSPWYLLIPAIVAILLGIWWFS